MPLGYFAFGGGFAWGVALLGGCRVLGYLVYCFGGLNLVFAACFGSKLGC